MIRRGILLGASILALGAWVSVWSDVRSIVERRKPLSQLLGVSTAGATGAVALILIFQPDDCLKSDRMLDQWKRYQDGGTVVVVGRIVGDGTLSAEQDARLRQKGLDFSTTALPMRAAALIAARLGYSQTPFAVVLDRGGRVVGSFAADDSVSVESYSVRQAVREGQLQGIQR